MMSSTGKMLVLLCVCVTAGLCDKTTNINLCCPKDQAHVISENNEALVTECTPLGLTDMEWEERVSKIKWNLEELNSTEINFSSSTEDLYKCSKPEVLLQPLDFLIPGITERRITPNGSLQVDRMNSTFSFDIEDICLSLTDLFSEENKEELQLRAAYFICYDLNPKSSIVAEEEFSGGFYPLSVFLSSVFVLFTITIYVIIKDLRKNIFGKLTLGFLINVFIAYFTAGIVHSLNYFDPKQSFRGTWGCIVFGYIIQHTYVAIFFWTNAMAFTLLKTFSNVLLQTVQTANSKKKLLLSIIYAQGMPLIVTLVTILMDHFGSEESHILPNMGKYRCGLGSEFNFNITFLKTSRFLYFYLIILIITLVNIICYMITAYNFISHWLSTNSMFSSDPNSPWSQIKLVAKLFFIMGIPYGFDFVSIWIEHAYGTGDSFGYRLTLDILNLLTGIFIFIALCCKKSVLMNVLEKCRSISQRSISRSISAQTQTTQVNYESLYLRKFSTFSNQSSVSNKTQVSEMVISEEEEEERADVETKSV